MISPASPIASPLLASGPAADLPADANIFAPFIGSWDLDVRWFSAGREIQREHGEWHFGWILGGRAVQDVWIVPPRLEHSGSKELYEYGTSIRFYDPALHAWQSTWHGPVHTAVKRFLARRAESDVVLTGLDPGEPIQWVFSDVEADRFSWRYEIYSEAASAWECIQRFECSRRC